MHGRIHRSAQIFQKSRKQVKIVGVGMVTWSKFSNRDPQTLGAIVQNLVARATWLPGFVNLVLT
jgi:hypothetical protein